MNMARPTAAIRGVAPGGAHAARLAFAAATVASAESLQT